MQLPSGLGALVVDGTARAALPLRCDFCDARLEEQVQARFDGVVYFGGPPGGQELAANELVFGLDDPLVDISPLVADALVAALPPDCLCAACRAAGGEAGATVWASAPAAVPPSSPFAKLAALKGAAQKRKQ